MNTNLHTLTFDPAKWRVVPVEPTEEMYSAAADRIKRNTVETWAGTLVRDPISHTWIALLAAAPEPPDAEAAGVKVLEDWENVRVPLLHTGRCDACGRPTTDPCDFDPPTMCTNRIQADTVVSAPKCVVRELERLRAELLRLNAEQAKAEPAAGVSELLKDCYYNLEGVIMDAEREGLDAVCLKTIKYVQGQITKARLAARGK